MSQCHSAQIAKILGIVRADSATSASNVGVNSSNSPPLGVTQMKLNGVRQDVSTAWDCAV